MSKARRGIYAAVISPFDDAGCLDTSKLVDHCHYLISEGGCDGVAPLGTTGEGSSIALSEKMLVADKFAAAGFETDRIIFGTGACSPEDAKQLTLSVIEAGFTNVLVLPPFYYKNPSDEGLYEYYSRLIESIKEDALRMFLYHFPQMSQVSISTGLINRLRRAYGPIVAGVKDSSGDIEQSRKFVENVGGVESEFFVYPSSEAFLLKVQDMGFAGIISGSTNAFGKFVRNVINADEANKESEFEQVRAARSVAESFPLVAAMKWIEAYRSGDKSWLRTAPPLCQLNADQQNSLRSKLYELGWNREQARKRVG